MSNRVIVRILIGLTLLFLLGVVLESGRVVSHIDIAPWSLIGGVIGLVLLLRVTLSRKELEALVSERTAALRQSEERFRHLFEENHAVMLIIDPADGAIVDANPAACAFYGYAKDVLLTMRVADINPMPPDELRRQIDAAHAGARRHFTVRHRLATGQLRDVDIYSGTIHYDDRVLLCSIIFDITDRLRVERALELQHAYLSAAVDTLTVPFSLISLTDNRQWIKNRAEDALCARLGVEGLAQTELLDPIVMMPLNLHEWPMMRALYRGETTTGAEYILRGPTGVRVDILEHASPVLVDGKVVAGVRVIEDITPLKEADHAKNEFLAMLSHELLTPLTSILGWTELALSKEQPDLMRQALAVVQRNARRQQRLLRDMLDMSKLLHGKLDVTLQPEDLGEQIRQALDTMQPMLDAWGGQLEWTPPPGPLPVRADAVRLQQCLGNLLQNGIKFTPAEGRITITCAREGDAAVVTVRDTGRGIAPEALPSVFAPFRQVDRDERVGGLGLGLALVSHLVALHDGHVAADSPGLGHGSTFRLELPLDA